MQESTAQRDIAGENYWSKEWQSEFDSRPEDPDLPGWRNHATRRFDELFQRYVPRESVVLEVGCARSRWLPYFAQRFGASLKGLDYSAIGCEQARAVLRSAGLDGQIIHGDLFAPPTSLVGSADVVFSWGLVEHFADTRTVAAALHALARPGGLVITVIPNMTHVVGALQRWVNSDVYALHVPLGRADLEIAFAATAEGVELCDYFLAMNFWVVNPGTLRRFWPTLVHRLAQIATAGVWRIESALRVKVPASAACSPYIVCVSRRSARG
jgi:SAM-dependent methyltransferase